MEDKIIKAPFTSGEPVTLRAMATKEKTKYNVDCKRYRNGTCPSFRCPCYMFSPVPIQDQINTGEEYKKFAREHNIKE